MPVEFLGIGGTRDGTETHARSTGPFDKEYTPRLARAHEDHGWDRVLFASGSGSAATGGAGNSNALVGTPETVAAALLD
jgi:alkanesulfonate monooxygenase SsuD/methylene tetrahydromethanopterin reductase-like flavin-dependent oxidoreductase (luciferase family)